MAAAAEWAMANKVKTGLAIVAALIPLVVAPVSFVAWAEGQTADQIRDAELIRQGREQVIHSTQKATHDYDFYSIRVDQAEGDLIELEQQQDEGVQLTSSQQRKMRKLEQQIEDFEHERDNALEVLQETEAEHETE